MFLKNKSKNLPYIGPFAHALLVACEYQHIRFYDFDYKDLMRRQHNKTSERKPLISGILFITVTSTNEFVGRKFISLAAKIRLLNIKMIIISNAVFTPAVKVHL